MRVKRYVVDSMPDALQKIRNDLGKDAVILNTKEIRSGGFLGLFGKKKIEVIAATDAQSQPEPRRESQAAFSPAALSAYAKPQANRKAGIATLEQPPKTAAPASAPVPAPVPAATAEPAVPEVPAYIPGDKPMKRPELQPANRPVAPVTEENLLDEIRQMKKMMKRLSRTQTSAPALNPPLAKLRARLLDQEVEESLADEIVFGILDEWPEEQDWTEGEVWSAAGRKLVDLLASSEPKPIASDTRVAHFVGPTGVGKTTTIAKLAAEQVLKHRRKVGFITSDTYRIAAVEQLKTYATILNIPLEVVFSPQDLRKAFTQLKGCDLIFMDTAGRNYRNELYVSELNALLQSSQKSETFLVLSLTTKYKDMKAIANNFSKFKLDKLLFTKMDETESYGPILNLVHDFSLKLSYVTNGQNVPDDITQADEEHIMELILGETEHE